MKSLNSALTASIALTAALVAGSASAASASVQQSQYGNGIAVSSASHYDSVEQVTIDGANLGSNAGNSSLYIGSK
jgi:hypothetical protein